MDAGLWQIIGEASGGLIMAIIRAVARGEEWEPLVDKFSAQLKINVAQELHRSQTVDELNKLRQRILETDG